MKSKYISVKKREIYVNFSLGFSVYFVFISRIFFLRGRSAQKGARCAPFCTFCSFQDHCAKSKVSVSQRLKCSIFSSPSYSAGMRAS